jgi:hypothetical protein
MTNLNANYISYETEYSFDDECDDYTVFASITVPMDQTILFEEALEYSRIDFTTDDQELNGYVFYEVSLVSGNHPDPHEFEEYNSTQAKMAIELRNLENAMSEFCLELCY